MKNTFKLLTENFTMVWKIMLYKVIVFVCMFGLSVAVSLPIIKELTDNGFFTMLSTTVQNMFFNVNFPYIINSLSAVLLQFWNIVTSANLSIMSVSLFSAIIIAYYYVDGLCVLPITDCIYGYMSSMVNYGFTNSYISNFGKSCKYQLVKLLFAFLADLIIISLTILIYLGMQNVIVALAPVIAIFFMIIAFSVKITIFAGWNTAIIVQDKNIFSCLKMSLQLSIKHFVSVFTNSVVMVIIIMFLNVFAVIFTLGAALFFTIPLSLLLLVIFNNVLYYEGMGMRYYSDINKIEIPKKLEEQDKYFKAKYII